MNPHKSAPLLGLILTALAALAMAGCSSNSETAANDHNDYDVSFAREMIPHHAQAVAMSRLAEERASKPEAKDLANRIEAAQQPEIDIMNGWLKSWGQPPVDPAEAAAMDHSHHGGLEMGGMMSADGMSNLEKATGAEFDRLFLEGMIKHHEGAVAMAKTQQGHGKFPPAEKMAAAIISSQLAEIQEMKQLLAV